MQRRYRVVVAPTGFDDHDRGARVLARALREAGFEVIVTAGASSARRLTAVVRQEDADAVGLTGLPSPGAELRSHLAPFELRSHLAPVELRSHLAPVELRSHLSLAEAGDVVVFDHDPQGGPTADLIDWLGAVLDEREGPAPARLPA